MLGSVEVNGIEFLRCDRADAEVAARQLAGEPFHVRLAQIDLELQFLHETSANNAFSFPQLSRNSVRDDQCDKRMTACFSSPAGQILRVCANACAARRR